MRNFLKEIREKVLVFDGSKGYLLQKLGLKGGECPEAWNIEHREEVRRVYRSYKDAGSDVIQTNTFQGNRLQLEKYSLGDRTYEINYESTSLAREVMADDGFVAASIGPIGKLFEPSGELTFGQAYDVFKEQVQAVADGGADIINFETFTDIAEMRAALMAAKDTCNLPVICSVSFEANGRTLMGTDPYTAAVILRSLGADMIGTNCSLGPAHLVDIIRQMHDAGGIYLSAKPNAGLPEMVDGGVVYKETPENFSNVTAEFVKYGVRLLGGCCGTTPEFIRAIRESLKGVEVPKVLGKSELVIASGVRLLNMEKEDGLSVGRIDASRDDELFEELRKGNLDYIVDKAIDLSCEGYDAIYINVDKVPGDKTLLSSVTNTAQSYIKEPFILESQDSAVLSATLRLYKGKAGIIVNSCDEALLEEQLKVAKKYGSTILDRHFIEK